MSTKALEEKLAGLAARMEKLEALVAGKPGQGWKAIIGTSKGDALDREAAELGAAWRAKANKRK